MKKKYKLSIIILSFNTKDLLAQCLDSIYSQTKQTSYEVIIVDNGSVDASKEMIQSQNWPFPISLIINDHNVGFGTANNQAAEKAQGEWLLLLNSDTILKNNTIDKMFEYIQSLNNQDSNNIYAPQLLNHDNSIQPSAGFFPTIQRVFAQMLMIDDLPIIKNIIKPSQVSNHQDYTLHSRYKIANTNHLSFDWTTGAFLLLKKETFQSVNGFDPAIFMYGEEVDLSYRIAQSKPKKASGILFPNIHCYHLKGRSSKDGFKAAVLGEYKGLITFYTKHLPHQINLLKLAIFLGALLRIAIFGIIDPYKAKIYLKALQLVCSKGT